MSSLGKRAAKIRGHRRVFARYGLAPSDSFSNIVLWQPSMPHLCRRIHENKDLQGQYMPLEAGGNSENREYPLMLLGPD